MKIPRISFRQLQETDLPLMHRWLNTSHVNQWWGIHGHRYFSLDEVSSKYLPRINGKEPVKCHLVSCNGKPIGMVQSYLVDDYPSAKEMFELNQNCAGIDIFIGEEDFLHRGLGSLIIKKYLQEIVFDTYDVPCCIIDPDPKNEAAIKAYEKAGFKYIKNVWNPHDSVDAYVMSVNRDVYYPWYKRKRQSHAGRLRFSENE